MAQGLGSVNNISFFLVFLEGILSFFSPCVIPLIPIYIGYLTGNTQYVESKGTITFWRKKTILHTVCFVLGISFAFFILGMSFTLIGRFLQEKQLVFTRIAGVIIICLGLFQLGLLNFGFLAREKKINIKLNVHNVNPLVALIMGFTFSFAWTPCVGPILSSVLLLASTASSPILGNVLVFLYTLGFTIPFLLLGLFTTQVLNFLRQQQKLLKYTVKVGGLILIIMGIMTLTGWLNGISGYLNSLSSTNITDDIGTNSSGNIEAPKENADETEGEKATGQVTIPAINFTLTDQYGNTHTLADYKGKVVFLSFWATWCPPCRKEMPDIQELYEKYNFNQGEVVFLGVANPRSEKNKNTRELDKAGVIDFLEKNGYTFPVVFDETGEVFTMYGISALPTTFLINKEGNIYGYAPGMLTKDMMESVILETIKSTE